MGVDVKLPPGVQVLERGWLSSNNILFVGQDSTALIDSGYCTHSAQTLQLVESGLQRRTLDLLLNTHLHSDHCGGNAALQARYPQLQTLIPPGESTQVAVWNEAALSYQATGQNCPRFGFDATLQPGTEVQLGDQSWQVHAAPGHDTHSVVLFEPISRLLVSADALWQRGFGVVFPELDGDDAFDCVGQTLDLIEALQPALVIPGHGAPFTDVTEALARARQRLDGFVADPARHLQHAAKVLLKFKLLEWQSVSLSALQAWAEATPYVSRLVASQYPTHTLAQAVDALVHDLVRAGAATLQGQQLHNA
ncbi:MBL fold metallo-hydrolase [Rhodoferax lacus]|uniref:MBL fold metallo-hydrolase n=1 Tax=Rhodoferax lacus TaxID=2184758 RepID=A0A3E1R9V0_9BURK|nr:MBL fold metallo-hydrolase [Rhodoferax lacus]RFO96144.1 MBL fold metallo-hydrolase [Rhodoferax lacus]